MLWRGTHHDTSVTRTLALEYAGRGIVFDVMHLPLTRTQTAAGFGHAVATRVANAEDCQRVYGYDLCQHNFADMVYLRRRPVLEALKSQFEAEGNAFLF